MTIDQAMITKVAAQDIFPIAGGEASSPSAYERIVASDSSALLLDGTTAVPLQELVQQPELRAHLMGAYQRVPFVVRAYDTRTMFAEGIRNVREALAMMNQRLTDYQYERLHITRAQLRSAFMSDPATVCSKAQDLVGRFERYLGARSLVEKDPELMQLAQHLESAVNTLVSLSATVRVTVPQDQASRADSLLWVTHAEEGAKIFMGWKANVGASTPAAEAVRKQLMGGKLPVERFLHEVGAKQGGMFGIPQYVPFGMTGGIAAIGVELPGRGFPLSSGGSEGRDVILEQIFEHTGNDEMMSLFTEGRIPAAKLDPRSLEQSGGYVRHYDVMNGTPLIEIGDCAVSRIAIPSTAGKPQVYRAALGSPTVWVMEQGAMRVVSPQGTVVDMSEGDACFVAAAAQGIYTLLPRMTDPDAAVTRMSLLTVTGMNPLSCALAASGCAVLLAGAPFPAGLR